MTEIYLAAEQDRPAWLDYPHSFQRIVEQQLIHLTPWHIFDATRAMIHFRGLKERFPSRALFPFAYRQDNDDLACWSKGFGEKVFIIHDFSPPGMEAEGEFNDVWAWFRDAVNETIEWD